MAHLPVAGSTLWEELEKNWHLFTGGIFFRSLLGKMQISQFNKFKHAAGKQDHL